MYKKMSAYFKKHVAYTATIHFLGGIGVGILITYPFAGVHPLRWGILFLAISLLGHLYAFFA